MNIWIPKIGWAAALFNLLKKNLKKNFVNICIYAEFFVPL